MPTPNLPMRVVTPSKDRHSERLIRELGVAIKALDRSQFLAWAADSVRMTGYVLGRRVRRVGALLKTIGRSTITEVEGVAEAVRDGRLAAHSKGRGWAFVGSVRDMSKTIRGKVTEFGAMVRDPEKLPEAVVAIVAALVSSGGFDADGGIPDLDLQFGIGAHRSIFTHSIIAGSVVEGSLYSVATLVGLTYRHLPAVHDPFWDAIEHNRERFLIKVAHGASAGFAYHFLLDGTVQAGTYHDLPVDLPLAGHGGVLVANAVAEAVDIPAKKDTFRQARGPR